MYYLISPKYTLARTWYPADIGADAGTKSYLQAFAGTRSAAIHSLAGNGPSAFTYG